MRMCWRVGGRLSVSSKNIVCVCVFVRACVRELEGGVNGVCLLSLSLSLPFSLSLSVSLSLSFCLCLCVCAREFMVQCVSMHSFSVQICMLY